MEAEAETEAVKTKSMVVESKGAEAEADPEAVSKLGSRSGSGNKFIASRHSDKSACPSVHRMVGWSVTIFFPTRETFVIYTALFVMNMIFVMQKNNILSHTKIQSLLQLQTSVLVCVLACVFVYLHVLVCWCACMCVSACVGLFVWMYVCIY